MHLNYVFSDVNEALPRLLKDLDVADEVGSRAGRTKELTHIGITLTDPCNRYILGEHRKANIAAQIAETMWVLSGRDDMEFLSHYLPRALDFSDDGKTWRAGYGKRLRHWGQQSVNGVDVDQLAYVVDLLKRDPGTRQAVMSIWDPEIDTEPGKDIPCNDWLSFISRLGYLDLHVALRSNDVIWGWSGINQFEWSALLEVVAGLTGLKVGSLHFSTTSFHIYDRHWAKGKRIADAGPWHPLMTAESPRFNANADVGTTVEGFDALCEHWFRLEYDIRTGSPLVGGYIDQFPEPMLRSWLRVLDWWWNGRHASLEELGGTALEYATHVAVQPPSRAKTIEDRHEEIQTLNTFSDFLSSEPSDFIKFAIRTHDEKHAAYGPSWRKRGESFSIMPNIARKVDRVGAGTETSDETSADTALDLMVYCAKYLEWLEVGDTDNTSGVTDILLNLDRVTYPSLNEPVEADYIPDLQQRITDGFDRLLDFVEHQASAKARMDQTAVIMENAYRLAIFLHNVPAKEHDDYRGADVD